MQTSVAHLHHQSKRLKRQFRDDFAFEERIEESEDDEEDESDDGAGLKLKEGEIAAGFLEAGLDAVDLLGLGFLGGDLGRVGLHGLELLGGLVNGGSEGFIGVGAVDEEPRDGLADDGGANRDPHHPQAVGVLQRREHPGQRHEGKFAEKVGESARKLAWL